MNMKRRQFIGSSTIGALAAGSVASRSSLAATSTNDEILVHIFLRGGIDGFNVVVPLDPKDHEYYSIMRPTLAIPDSGSGSALPIGSYAFGLNPVAGGLKDLFDAGHLAIVQAAGTANALASRSHFDAEKYIELGTPGLVGTTSGWLHRHFHSMTETLDLYPDEIFIPIVAFRSNPATSLLGNNSALTVWSPSDFKLDNAHWRWNYQEASWTGEKGYMQLEMLPDIYGASSDEVSHAGHQSLAAEAILRTQFNPGYAGSGTIPYPNRNIAMHLRNVAQMIKLDLGARIFVLDHSGFDSHTSQNNPENFDNLVADLSNGLAAFMDDLESSGGSFASRTTVIIQSEFGRRAYQNIGNGTDHGNGNIMLVVGSQVNGGVIYGQWPGLYPGTADGFVNYPNPKNGSTQPELFEGALSTTTDFRRVLSEYLQARCQHTAGTLGYVFPNYTGYSPMGIFNPLAEPEEMIFKAGFES